VLVTHPEFDEFLQRARRVAQGAGGLSGTYYRTTGPKYISPKDIVSGLGAMKGGGRWSPIGVFPAVYASTTPETATAEAFARGRFFGVPDYEALPVVMVALDIHLAKSLNLSARDVRRTLQVSRADLVDVNWRAEQDAGHEALTQAIARAAFAVGFEGLIVPSTAAREGINIVVFPTRLGAASRLEVRNPDDLDVLIRPVSKPT